MSLSESALAWRLGIVPIGPVKPFCRISAMFAGVGGLSFTKFGCAGSSVIFARPGPTSFWSNGVGGLLWQAAHFWANVALPEAALPFARLTVPPPAAAAFLWSSSHLLNAATGSI